MLISLLKVNQEQGVKKGDTWRTLMIPDRKHGGKGHPWCYGWFFFTFRKITWEFRVYIFIGSVSGRGDLEGIEGSWSETWRTGSSMTLWIYLVDPNYNILKRLCYYLYFWKCIRNRGSRRGYSEDVDSSWQKTGRTGSSLMSWMMFFYPKEDTLKVLVWYLYWKCVRKGGTGDMEDRVIQG